MCKKTEIFDVFIDTIEFSILKFINIKLLALKKILNKTGLLIVPAAIR